MTICIVVAGGKATRMGPWAPKPKPFLGIGPWDDQLREGQGPSVVWRALTNLSKHSHNLGVSISSSLPKALVEQHCPAHIRGLSILRDTYASPLLGPLKRLWDLIGGTDRLDMQDVVLHNGDDLIAPAAVEQFFTHVPNTAPVLLAVEHEQRGEFGMIRPGNTIDEKPVLARGWIGAGLVYLPRSAVEFALKHEIANVSLLINQLQDEQGVITRVVRSREPWATISNPEQYVKVCEDSTWHLKS